MTNFLHGPKKEPSPAEALWQTNDLRAIMCNYGVAIVLAKVNISNCVGQFSRNLVYSSCIIRQVTLWMTSSVCTWNWYELTDKWKYNHKSLRDLHTKGRNVSDEES